MSKSEIHLAYVGCNERQEWKQFSISNHYWRSILLCCFGTASVDNVEQIFFADIWIFPLKSQRGIFYPSSTRSRAHIIMGSRYRICSWDLRHRWATQHTVQKSTQPSDECDRIQCNKQLPIQSLILRKWNSGIQFIRILKIEHIMHKFYSVLHGKITIDHLSLLKKSYALAKTKKNPPFWVNVMRRWSVSTPKLEAHDRYITSALIALPNPIFRPITLLLYTPNMMQSQCCRKWISIWVVKPRTVGCMLA